MQKARMAVRGLALGFGLAATASGQTISSPQQFVDQWGKAWENHDIDAIMRLHADDCVSVNRFGVTYAGKDEIRRGVTWLQNGPFHVAHFGTPHLLDQRRIAPGVLTLHASWTNPSGKPSAPEDQLVMTVVLRDFGAEGWLAEEIDTHTVEPLAPAVAADAAPEKP